MVTISEKSISTRPIVIAIIVGAIIIGIGLAIGLGVGLRDSDDDVIAPVANGEKYKSSTGTFQYAAVVADSEVCSEVGNDVLARLRGNAMDATVATLFCTGVINSHSAGIGGGSFYTIYHKSSNTFYNVISRETAPAASTQDMFQSEENQPKSLLGGMAVGIPGEVLGLYEVHQRFGTVPWKSLVMPSIKLCEEGFPLTEATHNVISRIPDKTKFAPYFNADGSPKAAGSLIKFPELARTFRTIADDPLSFYNGTLAADIVSDITDEGGIITIEDLANYKLTTSAPTNISLPGGYQVFSTPPPGSGLVLSYILGILSGYNMDPSNIATTEEEILTYHRIVEAFKFAFGKRSELGDDRFHDNSENAVNMTSRAVCEEIRQRISDEKTHDIEFYNPAFSVANDSGTAHISVIDGEGNAVSVTSTINTYFGSKVRGSRTGIVFNNEMDDFSTPGTVNYFGLPASPANFIQPGKRPMSSMCPVIVWDNNEQRVKMISGGSGGTRITTANALSIIDVLWLGMSLPESIDKPRLHHQLVPNAVQMENTFSKVIADGLEAKGHAIRDNLRPSVLQAINVRDDGSIVGTADFRKGGVPKGY
ncbi:glutathione hydrolase 1 proenzyme [Aplysia californica]|uniref:Glutathione hydrolase 1 proenzyme n=1 Tax=Aplysia californica TaxID=6500 RepID=A0ABM0JZM5_APLCA|nr:glutathione hydrolase 1 proenzyme [Aplysia californica]